MTDGCKFCTLCFGVYVSDIFFLSIHCFYALFACNLSQAQ